MFHDTAAAGGRPVTEVAAGIHLISDYHLDNYYLVEGEDRALLIDCGAGIGDPWLEIRALTSKPVTLALTHGHMDHCGNADKFARVLMHPDDAALAREHFGHADKTRWFVRTRTPVRYPGHEAELLVLVPREDRPLFAFVPVRGGDRLDLGGRTLKVIATPGHTPGSLCYLDTRSRLLFSGDTLNDSIIVLDEGHGTREGVAQLRETMQALAARYADFDAILPGHEDAPAPKDRVLSYLDLCNRLLDGSLRGRYEEREIRAGHVVRGGGVEFWYRADR